MATKRKTPTKKDLEAKIADLEAQLSKLESEVGRPAEKPKETKPKETPKPEPKVTKPKGTLPKGFDSKPAEKPKETKPKETPKPEPKVTKPKGTLPKGFDSKPAEKPKETKPKETPKPEPKVTKPKGTLPKGFDSKPAEKPKEAPKPTPKEETTQPPVTYQAALEDAYYNSPQTSFHEYRAKVTGYSPAPNRYYVRLTAPVGKVKTTNWNEQKASVTGYTQPSNQYFATRPRLAYHPPDKTFGGFSGMTMTVDGMTQNTSQKTETPKPQETTQQADTSNPPPQQSSTKSRSEELAEYEQNYLKRLEEDQAVQEQSSQETQPDTSSLRGTLPKGFKPQPPPEPPKPSRGTLPKGF